MPYALDNEVLGTLGKVMVQARGSMKSHPLAYHGGCGGKYNKEEKT